MRSFSILLILLSVSSSGWSQGEAVVEQDSLTFEHNYQALFDTTQTKEIFLETLLRFRDDLKNVKAIDTGSFVFANPNSSREMVYFEDSMIFENATSSSWSGSSSTSSTTLYYRGKPIYLKYSDLLENLQLYEALHTPESPRTPVLTRHFEYYNFWNRMKVSFQYEYTLDADEVYYSASLYDNILHLNSDITVERITSLKYEPIDENHRLKRYFENSLRDGYKR